MAAEKSSRRRRAPVSPRRPPLVARQVQVSELSLQTVVMRLRQARSVAITAVMALVHQNADVDSDIASVLGQHVVDALTKEIETLDRALGTDSSEG